MGVVSEFDVPARMRDGVTLYANVYRPAGPGPWPTLLMRLPYGKDDPQLMEWLDPTYAARRGFMVVVQDTRGRFASEGDWVPFRFEGEDGYDSVEWAARLPGSNGRVGMYGLSYFGSTQWLAALERPPALCAIAPGMTWSEPTDGLVSRGGALELGLALRWTLQTGANALSRRIEGSSDERERRVDAILDDYDALPSGGYWDLPVTDAAVLRRNDVLDLGTIRMGRDPSALASCRVAGRHDLVDVPTFHVAGWHDLFLQGTLDNYMAMAELGRPARLVVGPWAHITFSDPVGELCYGVRASRIGIPAHAHGDLNDEQLGWFSGHLGDSGAAGEPPAELPVRIFVMGRDEWRDEPAWPPARARYERWFLHTGGELRRDDAGEAAPTEFAYDPGDPVPTVGGQTLLAPAFPPGPFDQAGVEARADVCVFTSEPLEADLEVTGRVRVVLHAQSSAPSTDWVARLCDVHPDGRSFNVCDGIVRVHADADVAASHEIDLWSTSIVFLRGHRLRVHVTSSSFPRWDRNLNTGKQSEARWQVASQRIHHSAARPSYVELPIID